MRSKILGVGLEIVEQEELAKILRKDGKKFSERYFTLAERKYCDGKRHPLSHYAARWACKKATVKALGLSDKQRGPMKEIEVKMGREGQPKIYLGPRASKRSSLRIRQIKASLSHSDSYSVAEVILLGEQKQKAEGRGQKSEN